MPRGAPPPREGGNLCSLAPTLIYLYFTDGVFPCHIPSTSTSSSHEHGHFRHLRVSPASMAATNQSVFSHPTFCVITGASKGLGRCMAVRFAGLFPSDSVLLLVARSADLLDKTRQLALDQNPRGLRVKVAAIDLGGQDREGMEALIRSTLNEYNAKPSDFKQGKKTYFILFKNNILL